MERVAVHRVAELRRLAVGQIVAVDLGAADRAVQVVAVERVEVGAAVVEGRDRVGAENRVDGRRVGDHDTVEGHALVALWCRRGVGRDRLGRNQHRGR